MSAPTKRSVAKVYSRWIKANGTEEQVCPEKAKWSLKELQEKVGGYIEIIGLWHTGTNEIMVVNEERFSKRLPFNKIATFIAGRDIVGDVLVVPGSQVN